ncbi:MAG: hypothetical protein AAF600_19835 [Bacteroidota bacterium]
MKKITMIIFGLIMVMVSMAQEANHIALRSNYPDSLVLMMDNKNEIIFLFNRMSRKSDYFSSDLWKSMLSVMETAVERSEIQEGIQILYEVSGNEEAKITISELEPVKSIFLIQKDGIKETLLSRIEFLIVQPHVAVSFSIYNSKELNKIKELNVASVWSGITDKSIHKRKESLYLGKGKVKYNEATIDKIEVNKQKLDFMEISAGVGLGYYRDRFVPDWGSKLAFQMHDRLGNKWLEFGFLYTQQYFFERDTENDYDLDLNGFLTGFWKIHAGGMEYGIGIGSIIHREGDFYEGDTWKLTLHGLYGQKKKSLKFTYTPELIFTNDFKQVFPALRIGLSF